MIGIIISTFECNLSCRYCYEHPDICRTRTARTAVNKTFEENLNVTEYKEMIKNAGLGVAMKQSTPIVLELADEITQGNNEEGVAKILQKYYKNINF